MTINMMRITNKIINKMVNIFIISIIIGYGQVIFANSKFFNERYRGWLWFEERPQIKKKVQKEVKNKKKYQTENPIISPEKAAVIIAQKQKQLTDAKNIMLAMAYSNNYSKRDYLEAVRKYKALELDMQNMAVKVGKAWAEVNLLYPKFTDEYNNPTNIYGRKLQEELEAKRNRQILENLAETSNIYIFRSGDCHYCHKMEKHLASFAKKYGFKVEAVSVDNSKSEYFKTNYNKNLAIELGVEISPTVFLVNSNQEYHRYQIAIGAVSVEDLENNCIQAAKLLKEGISNDKKS